MKYEAEVVAVLSDGKFHSGSDLAKQLNVSRATIWKVVDTLKKRGLEVFAVSGKGYRLQEPFELLHVDSIRSFLDASLEKNIQSLDLHWDIDSTNGQLLGRVGETDVGEPSDRVAICLAEQQTQGRGRRGRNWVSPVGGNILLSLMWHFPNGTEQLTGLSLAAALAVTKALRDSGINEVGLKWPNDILVRDQKLAGLLLEISGESYGPSQVVIGLGLNINISQQSGDNIDQPWVDLYSLGYKNISRNQLVARIITQLMHACEQFKQHGLTPFLEDWQKYDLNLGKKVLLRTANEQIEGVVRGVDEQGALLLAKDGKLFRFYSGEVSLRPLVPA